jgi:hypothetical protein
MKRILHLNLKAEYFNEIKKGNKVYEYRRITPYWRKRLKDREYDEVHVKLGYPKKGDRGRTLKFKWNGYMVTKIKHKHFGQYPVVVFAIRLFDERHKTA